MATLIRKTSNRGGRRAVLYLHGWNDYFFQTHLAEYLSDIGYDFYALDLRRYGRSMRPGLLRGFITDLDDYGLELDAAVDDLCDELLAKMPEIVRASTLAVAKPKRRARLEATTQEVRR